LRAVGDAAPSETVDLRGGENRREPFLSRSPGGTCPALALDNGMCWRKSSFTICEYLDEIGPAGSTLI
jgi:glutathione S-transferase